MFFCFIFKYLWNGQVSGNLTCTVAIPFFKKKKSIYVKLLERHPFSGRCDSAGELLHTPYADSNFCGHGPDVYTTRNTLSLIGRLEQICFGPAYLENVRLNPSSPELLTSYGPLRIFDTRSDLRLFK
jgi:hypothetical protein